MADGRKNNGGARPGAGRKKEPVVQQMRDVLSAACPPAEQAAIIRAMVTGAKCGDVRAATFLFDRLFHKPTEKMELTGAEGGPVQMQIQVVYDEIVDAGNPE